jgi:hypothetical protein
MLSAVIEKVVPLVNCNSLIIGSKVAGKLHFKEKITGNKEKFHSSEFDNLRIVSMITRPMGLRGKLVSLPVWKRAALEKKQNAAYSVFCFFLIYDLSLL